MQAIDIDFLKKVTYPGQMATSPDHSRLVICLARMDMEKNNYPSDLWLYENENWRQLTSGGDVRSFSFIDEKTILFPAKRQEKEKEAEKKGLIETCYYCLPLDGGEAQPAFTVPLAVSQIEALGGERYLLQADFERDEPELFLAERKEREEKARAKKDRAFREHLTEIPFWFNGSDFTEGQRQGIFLFDARSGRTFRLSPADKQIGHFRLSEDKRRVCGTFYTAAEKMPWRQAPFVLELPETLPEDEKADLSELFQPLRPEEEWDISDIWEAEPLRGKDSSLFVLATDHRHYGMNESIALYELDRQSGKLHSLSEAFESFSCLNSDLPRGSAPDVLLENGAYYFFATQADHDQLLRINPNGQIEVLYDADGALLALAHLGDDLLVQALLAEQPAELYALRPDAFGRIAAQPLSNWHRSLMEELSLSRAEAVTSSRNPLVKGWVLRPRDFVEGQSYPAILDIHGGPRTAYGPVFFHEMQLWAAQGYFVLFCNPRGSGGQGDVFADIRGEYGGIDYEDLMGFTESCLAAYPMIDRDRVGVTGGSYGGFMSNWIIGHTNRFAACATQRSIMNWLSFYGVSDIGYDFATDQNATELNDQAGFLKLWDHSPLKYINSARTPTLIIHSDKDYRCPLEQGLQLFTALKDRAVPCEMYLFHDETHELSRSGKPQSRRERLRAITCWMNRWLQGHDALRDAAGQWPEEKGTEISVTSRPDPANI